MGPLSRLTKIFKVKRIKRFGPSLISLDSNPVPVGLFKTFTAGASITAGQVVSLHTDGKIYPSSSSYPNIVGIAIDSASAGGSVRVIVAGVAQATSDGAINPGDPLTYSTATAGRVVSYAGHNHSVSLSTGTAVTDVTASTTNVVGSVSSSTGTFVTGISVDRRNFTTASAVTSVSSGTGSFVTGISVDRRDFTTASAITSVSTSARTVVTGVSTTSATVVGSIGSDTDGTQTGQVTSGTLTLHREPL